VGRKVRCHNELVKIFRWGNLFDSIHMNMIFLHIEYLGIHP
jgi:hypothetical protein